VRATHGIRRKLWTLFDRATTRMGIRTEKPILTLTGVSDHDRYSVGRVIPKPNGKYSAEEFHRILSAPQPANNPPEVIRTRFTYVLTRWYKPIIGVYAWALSLKNQDVAMSSLKNSIGVRMPMKHEGEHGDLTDCAIIVDDENLLEWLFETCRGTVLITLQTSITMPMADGTVSVLFSFTNRTDAMAFKLAHFDLYTNGLVRSEKPK